MGGLSAAQQYIVELIRATNADIVIPVETKMQSHNAANVLAAEVGKALGREVRFVGTVNEQPLEHTERIRAPYAGVGMLITNPRISPRVRYSHRHLSVVTTELSIRGKCTFSTVGFYLPPANSTHANVLADSVTAIETEIKEEQRRGHNPLLLGDGNTRMGNSDVHSTCDQGVSSASRVCLLRGMLNRVGMREMHGRDGPASCTNWALGSTAQGVRQMRLEGKTAGSEVDFIACSKSMHSPADFVLHRVPQLDDDTRTRGDMPPLTGAPIHAPLIITLKLRPAAAGAAAAPVAPAPPPLPPVPDYENAIWHAAAAAAEPAIDAMYAAGVALEASGQLITDAAAVHGTYESCIGAIASTIQTACFGHRRDELPRRQPAHCDSADGVRRYHKNGERASPELLEARRALHRGAKVLKRLQAAGAAAQAARPGSNEQLAAAFAHHKQLNRAKSQAAKRSLRQAIATKAARDERMMRVDAHTAANNLKRENGELLFASQGRPHIPSPAAGPPATEAFPAFISSLIGPKPGEAPVPAVAAAAAAASAAAPIPAAMQAVPAPAAGQHMAERRVTAEDVYVALFPASKAVPYDCIHGQVTPGAVSACKTCAAGNAQLAAWNPDDPREEKPEFPTKLRTSKAPGPDGVAAELLCWLRPAERELRLPFRMKLCKALALFFTGFLALGKVPPSFKEGLSIALLKPSKAGAPVDCCAPDNYRFITMCNTLAKLFGTVLLVRCSHWGDRSGAISGSQNAFRSGRNCEQHVISLTELIRARKRAGSATWVLFVDFRKAYDTVNHSALWAVARRAGVAESIVRVLEDWNTSRTAKLRINGEMTAPYTIGVGVPQGDVLSPWLFNLFIESLVRTLQADAVFTGVEAFGLTVKELLYADDLALLCTSRAQIQRALDVVMAWCTNWGMRVSTGKKKTEVLVFYPDPPPGAIAALPPDGDAAPFRAGASDVEVTSDYRYLGHEVNAKLEFEPIIERYASKMWENYNRFFRTNAVAKQMSLRAQVIQLRTFVLSCTNFLASALPADDATQTAAMDAKVRDMLQNMLCLPGHAMTTSLWQEASVQPTITTWVRERTRVFLEVFNRTTYDESILLHRIIVRQQTHCHADTWLAHTFAMLRKYDVCVPPGHAPRAGNYAWALAHAFSQAPAQNAYFPSLQPLVAKQIAAVFAREVGAVQWLTLSQKKPNNSWSKQQWASRPPTGPRAFRAWLFGGYANRIAGIRGHAGWYKSCTPLSFTAPSGSGCIIVNAKMPMAASEPVRAARQGSFAHLCARTNGPGFRVLKTCEACHAASADPYHFLIECTEARCVAARAKNFALARGIVLSVDHHAREIATRVAGCLAANLVPLADAVTAAAPADGDATLWLTETGKAMMTRLAFAQPWACSDLPASITGSAEPANRLAVALGSLFDAIVWPRFLTRPLATEWTGRASKIQRICNAARDATHTDPEHQAFRRGGQQARDNNAAAATARREAAAAAKAAAAAGSGPLGSFHNLRAPGSIHLPARYLDAAEEDDLEPDSENPDDDGNDEDAASEDSDFYPS